MVKNEQLTFWLGLVAATASISCWTSCDAVASSLDEYNPFAIGECMANGSVEVIKALKYSNMTDGHFFCDEIYKDSCQAFALFSDDVIAHDRAWLCEIWKNPWWKYAQTCQSIEGGKTPLINNTIIFNQTHLPWEFKQVKV